MNVEDELLRTYKLKTLNPQYWEEPSRPQDSENVLFMKGDNSNETYTMLLNLLNEDSGRNDINAAVDPLRNGKSISQILKEKRIDPSIDTSEFSINSKLFNSKKFLKFIHNEDSFDQLTQSLNVLDSSIAEKNKELKQLVQHEFLRFVRSKSSVDGILKQFEDNGFNDEETGIHGLKASINEANKESTLLINPILTKKQKEVKLKRSIEFVEKNKILFDLPKSLRNYINDKSYDNLIHDYNVAKQMRNNRRNKVVDRIWEEVESIIDIYRRNLWTSLDTDVRVEDGDDEEFLKVIRKLMELDVIDDPSLEWIHLRASKFNDAFNEVFRRYHEKILNVQLNILSTIDEPDYSTFAQSLKNNSSLVDSTISVEMWSMIVKAVDTINDLASKFVKFWKHVEKFTNGAYQSRLESPYIDPGSPFLSLEKYQILDIKGKGEAFIEILVTKLLSFFNSDQSSLKSLHPSSNNHEGNIENFGFLPPFTNSLSTLRYLPTAIKSISEMFNDLGQLNVTDRTILLLRECSSTINQRFVEAVCASWLNDCHNFHKLEMWEKLETGETMLPSLIYEFESNIIDQFGGALFGKLPEAKEVQIVKYPSRKTLTGVQIQFLRSFDVLLESIIKKIIEENHDASISKKLKNYHKLLSLANLKKMTTDVLPSIIKKFDSKFDTSLSHQKLEIYAILQKMESTIFDSYITDQRKTISKIILSSIPSIDWAGLSESQGKVSSYIYELVSILVNVYTSVARVSTELIPRLLVDLLEYATANILNSLRDISLFSDDGLKQVVLDIEFFKRLIGSSLSQNSNNNLDLIYKNVIGSQKDLRQLLSSTKPMVDEHLTASRLEYQIFNS